MGALTARAWLAATSSGGGGNQTRLSRRDRQRLQAAEGQPAALAKTFNLIAATNAWGARETLSGTGSTLNHTRSVRRCLGDWIRRFRIRRIVDVGCGDVNWQRHIPGFAGLESYRGFDVSGAVIAAAAAPIERLNIAETVPPRGDLVILRDVLQHLPLQTGAHALRNVAASGARFLAVTTYPGEARNRDLLAAGGYFQPNVALAPFNLPPPVASCENYDGAERKRVPGAKFVLIEHGKLSRPTTLPKFNGQKDQDKWVHKTLTKWTSQTVDGPQRRSYYYVDLAANEPFYDSSTSFFDEMGWNGLCIDGNPRYIQKLKTSKRTCTVVHAIVDSCMDKEVSWVNRGAVGGIVAADTDNTKTSLRTVKGTTRTLADILNSTNAPRRIDFLSLDVEGAEWRAMQTFPFDKYQFLTIAIERPPPWLNRLLFKNRYVWVENSRFDEDSFFVHEMLSDVIKAVGTFQQVPTKCDGRAGTSCPWAETPPVTAECAYRPRMY